MTLSAVLIVKNEAKNIEACLGALRFAADIVVVDSGSTDGTQALARSLGVRVESRRFDDFSNQKNFAVSLAKENWILSVDADERVSEFLRDEILGVIADPQAFDAYRLRRRTNLFCRDFVAGGLQNDAPIRLFKRGKARFQNPVHEVVVVDGRVGTLKETLYHRSFQTVHEHLAKLQHYTEVDSRAATAIKQPSESKRFFIRPFYRFFDIYVLKQGFRDGIEGFFYSVLSAYYEWIRWMKRWERLQ